MPTILSQAQLARKRIGDINFGMIPQDIIEEVIKRIRYICDKDNVNLTKKELSIILGKSDGYISHIFYENHEYNPSLEIVIELSRLLYIPLFYLFSPKGEKFTQYYNDTEKMRTLKEHIKSEIEKRIKKPPYVEDEEKLIYRISRLEKIKERIEEELKNMK